MADIIEVSTRKFNREFADMKKMAKGGAKLRIRDGAALFRFELVQHRTSFLGCTKGTLRRQADAALLFSTGETWDSEAEQ